MTAPIIRVCGLTKHYRVAEKDPGLAGTLRHFFNRRHTLVEAVDDLEFTLQPGEVVGFLGPNGAGKTTALKMLSGLIHPTSGEVEVVGHTPFARKGEFLRQITLVMGQKQQLLWDLPARDTYRINGAVYDIADDVLAERIDRLAEMLEMKDNLSRPVRKLSLGERMKAELIAGLLHMPRVLFLDEPTLGLDIHAQDTIRAFLRDHCAETGATILLTSHYMADITALCDRVMVIDKGRLKYDGSLDEIVERFSPYREVKLELSEDRPAEAFEGLGEVESIEGRVVRLFVRREALTAVISGLMNRIPVLDMTVTDPPIEEVMGRVFASDEVLSEDSVEDATS